MAHFSHNENFVLKSLLNLRKKARVTFLFHVLSLARFGPFSHSLTKDRHELAITFNNHQRTLFSSSEIAIEKAYLSLVNRE